MCSRRHSLNEGAVEFRFQPEEEIKYCSRIKSSRHTTKTNWPYNVDKCKLQWYCDNKKETLLIKARSDAVEANDSLPRDWGFESRQTYDMTVSNLIRKPNILTNKLKCYQFREHQGCLRFADGGVVGDREDGGVFDRNVVHRATKLGQANQERVRQLSRYRNVQSLRIEKWYLIRSSPQKCFNFFSARIILTTN